MKIQTVEAIPLAVSFKETFRFGTTDRSLSPNVIIIIRTDDGHVGFGEACPVPAFTSETQQSIVELIEKRVVPVLVGRNPTDRLPLLRDLSRVLKFAPFTVAAVDTALLDLAGRVLGIPIHALLGGAFRDRVEVHGSVGWQEDPRDVAATAVSQATTYRWLKLYAGRGRLDEDLDRLQAVRDAVGPDVKLFVDVNGMWSPSDLIVALRRVEHIGLSLLEQPLALNCEARLADLVRTMTIDVVADESVRTVHDAARVASNRSATVINLGHSKLGGPSAAVQAGQIAIAAGLSVMVGSVIEMGVANAMGLHLAATFPDMPFPAYLMGPLKYREQITEEPLVVVDGHVAIPQGPGLGVTVDESHLRSLDVRLLR